MLIYWLNLLFLLIWSLLAILSNKLSRVFYSLIFLQLLLLLVLRSNTVGSDTNAYLALFEKGKSFPFWDFEYSRSEVGYLFLNKLLSFVESGQLVLMVFATIPMLIFFRSILKESKIPWLSLYLFITIGLYALVFNILRQVIAMAMIFVSFKYLVKNDFKRFFVLVAIASLFHASALIFLLTYFFRNMKLTFRNTVIYVFLAMGLYVFSQPILVFLINRFSTVQYELNSGGDLPLLLVMLLTLVAGLVFSKSVIKSNPRAIVLYNILYLGILFQILALEFTTFSRVTTYFMMFMVIFIPEVISSIKDRQLKIVGFILVIILTGIQYYITLIVDPNGIVPYSFFR
ncbi:EpsG family protein [Mesobacillus maritimus]|uniref:EpsG family protein n=1 Tax=Mesobacillus maritimus TaxID=1643336 RepID=A0ABS7K4Y3_9BACI|nr:EpsG family protein [Mesobacillus maritimus]MBY0097327.1 EpsG family protein [Mesobacillus maritimus]